MTENELLALTDEELTAKAKVTKPSTVVDALLIGFLIGIIFFCIFKSTWGLCTLIPFYFICKMVDNSQSEKVLEGVIKERRLKV